MTPALSATKRPLDLAELMRLASDAFAARGHSCDGWTAYQTARGILFALECDRCGAAAYVPQPARRDLTSAETVWGAALIVPCDYRPIFTVVRSNASEPCAETADHRTVEGRPCPIKPNAPTRSA